MIPNNLQSASITYTHPIMNTQKSDAYNDIFNQIKSIINEKNEQYKIDPISVLTIQDLLSQIKIKSVRAQCTFDEGNLIHDKLIDELYDVITYSILTLKKVNNKLKDETK